MSPGPGTLETNILGPFAAYRTISWDLWLFWERTLDFTGKVQRYRAKSVGNSEVPDTHVRNSKCTPDITLELMAAWSAATLRVRGQQRIMCWNRILLQVSWRGLMLEKRSTTSSSSGQPWVFSNMPFMQSRIDISLHSSHPSLMRASDMFDIACWAGHSRVATLCSVCGARYLQSARTSDAWTRHQIPFGQYLAWKASHELTARK